MSTQPVLPEAGTVTMFATSWCPYCRLLREALNDAAVPYTEVDVDSDASAAAFVESVNNGDRVVPTVLFSDGSTLTNPSIEELRQAL